jgi:hypothetical protein
VLGKASPDARATDDAGGGILCMRDFRAAREGNSWNPRPHHHRTRLAKAWEQTDRPAPLHQWDALTYTDASRRRVKLPCGRAVIRLGAAVYTTATGTVRTVDRTQPDGDTATTQSSWQYTQQSQTRGKSTSLPIVTDCAAAIDQIINVVHQPAKLTFHRHRALLQRIYDLLEREQTGNKAQSSC